MASLGFTTYIDVPPPPPPTLAERFAELTGAEKTAILNGFTDKIIANRLKRQIGLELDLIQGIYLAIDGIEEYSRILMRGELLITPAEIDPETGEVITPPVYNTPPATINELKTQVAAVYTEIFNLAEVGAVIDRMILYSETDENGDPIGTAAVYAAEVVK